MTATPVSNPERPSASRGNSSPDAHGISAELLGPDPTRLSFVARLKGSGARKPLLLVAHSDVVPAYATQWSVDPMAATVKDGVIYGRGAEDIKSLLAAELSG